MLEIDSPNCFVDLSDSLSDLICLTPALAEILQQERGVTDSKCNELRKYARFRCNSYGIMEQTADSNRNLDRQETCKVVIRDISRNGFGVIAHQQWYPTQIVRLSLPTGQSYCEVARVRFHGPDCFEIGLQVRKFVSYPNAPEQEV